MHTCTCVYLYTHTNNMHRWHRCIHIRIYIYRYTYSIYLYRCISVYGPLGAELKSSRPVNPPGPAARSLRPHGSTVVPAEAAPWASYGAASAPKSLKGGSQKWGVPLWRGAVLAASAFGVHFRIPSWFS